MDCQFNEIRVNIDQHYLWIILEIFFKFKNYTSEERVFPNFTRNNKLFVEKAEYIGNFNKH